MSDSNSHVEEFLNYYFSHHKEPGYAVLLKGKWGTGKTWFINKMLESQTEKQVKHLYVSLYGVTSFEEIEDEFFKQLHPLLSSKSMAFVGKIAKGLLKATLKVDLDGDGKSDGSVSVQTPEIDLPDYLKNTENFVIVFDDLERISMSLDRILGYINHFVEYQGYRVIIVANEDEILEQQNNDENLINSYKRTKEKLIGKTFEIKADLQGALLDFCSEIRKERIKNLYESSTDVISDIYKSSTYENLRHLKQALWDFERLAEFISEEASAKDGLLLHVLKIYLALSFEIKSGKMLPAEVMDLRDEYISGIMKIAGEEKKESNFSRMSKKYGNIDFSDLLLEESIWVDFIDRGYCSADNMQQSLEKSVYFRNETTPEWSKLWHSMSLSDEEFCVALELVANDYQERRYEELGVVKHIVGIFLWLSKANMYEKKPEEILLEAQLYIDHLKDRDLLAKDRSIDAQFRINESWGGLGFHERGSEEFVAFIAYIEKQTEIAIVDKYPDIGRELLGLIATDPNLFYRRIVLSNDAENIYYEVPILNHINPEDFVSSFLEASPDAKDSVCFALKKRYEYRNFCESLISELDWLGRVIDLLEKKRQELMGKISGYQLQSYIENYFKAALEMLENHTSTTDESSGNN
ncbi:P-loop NTPase fold protein [Granulosicoccus antarcticus]|uniref:KAP NTPase domain-containing protein n=1 Tax=Granulosicoccus antarcticus IMCC3135 TaxID=1192854 RepID=A0A2Z2P456_9GAMM|nr:P-loop NTPase fold protein [Granulosicoccus antarcticus]ASJ76200.1 hypothetical protein IMCC3135_30755 [Granulosicoccus antarcticus IMCC3135]